MKHEFMMYFRILGCFVRISSDIPLKVLEATLRIDVWKLSSGGIEFQQLKEFS